jgi:predicted RNase H-like HicB family nuclease
LLIGESQQEVEEEADIALAVYVEGAENWEARVALQLAKILSPNA